jgi:excisionase family DNA binding protein
MKLISTDEAAERLGVSGRRVRQLIDDGKLPAQYVGGGYVIDEAALEGVQVYGKPGRPPKASTEKDSKKSEPSPKDVACNDGRVTVKKAAKKGGK